MKGWHMLSVEKVNLHYGASHALKDVEFRAELGAVTCILGRNGVGKTSVLRSIMGLQNISDGRIAFGDVDITKRAAHDRARMGFAIVPQSRDIFGRLTVEENLRTGFSTLPRGERRVPDHLFDYFPVLKDMLGRRGGDLSGGQQQQLAITRALVTRPKVLLLDEPTEGIQPSIVKLIQRVIETLRARGDMAIVLVEQYFEFAHALADRIVVMDRGVVVMNGRRDDLDAVEMRRHMTV
jgi:urea transport system ATP-binding protein